MAKITLTIEAEDAGDLASALYGLVNMHKSTTSPARGFTREEAEHRPERSTDDEEPDAHLPFQAGAAEAQTDAEPGERQARKRRTKAEMEAAKATGDVEKTPASSGGPTTSASKDVFGDQLKEVVAEGTLSHDDVAAAGREAFEKIGAPRTQAILLELGGTKAFKSIPADKLAAVHAAFLAAIAEG